MQTEDELNILRWSSFVVAKTELVFIAKRPMIPNAIFALGLIRINWFIKVTLIWAVKLAGYGNCPAKTRNLTLLDGK